jgi:hypothetical protein
VKTDRRRGTCVVKKALKNLYEIAENKERERRSRRKSR